VLLDVDRSRVLWRRATSGVERLLWSDDGKRLLVATRPAVVLDARGRTIARVPAGAAAFVPHSEALGLAVNAHGRSSALLLSGRSYGRRRVVFSGAGVFASLAWSPDRRWLLVDWTTADQWVFVRVSPTPRVRTISDISSTFGTGPESRFSVAGWCCS
jgi:dipeptidyl aminopeptidase/acylaminoacyl peptidase